jgi:hypothetical protein
VGYAMIELQNLGHEKFNWCLVTPIREYKKPFAPKTELIKFPPAISVKNPE